MRRQVPTRLVVVAFAVGSLIVLPLAVPASAATGTACSGDKTVTNTKTDTATSTLTGCTNLPATGGKGTDVTNFKNTKSITSKITWNGTGTTTTLIKEAGGTAAQTAGCVKAVGKGAAAVVSTGTVTGGTGTALKDIPKGSKISETVCYTPKDVVTLYPGSKLVL